MEEEMSMDSELHMASFSDGLELSIIGSDNLGGEILEGLDSYLDDINDRLTISRMVNDCVIKGMVSAVAQDADERIEMKELEMAKLKGSLNLYHMSEVEFDSTSGHDVGREDAAHPHGSDVLVEHDWLRRSLSDLIASANDHFSRLQNDINSLQGYDSGMTMVELNGNLHDQKAEKWTDACRVLDSLKLTLEKAFKNVDKIVHLCDTSLREWKEDRHLQEKIEAMVVRHGILSLKEKIVSELEEHDDNASSNVNWCDSIGELSRLRRELDVISKALPLLDNGLSSHGSSEFSEEPSNVKGTDDFQHKTSLWEGNGKHDSQTTIPEILECAEFKNMTKDELFNYLKAEMIKMKRGHESIEHEMTEKYFSLLRKVPTSSSNKDKEFSAMRKSISEVIHKLDAILSKNDNVTKLRNSVEGLDNLKIKLDNALSENHHLKGLLGSTRNEIKRLSVFAAETRERMKQHSFTETNLLKKIHNLNNTISDLHAEAAISDEILKCALKGIDFTAKDWLTLQIQSAKEQEVCSCSVQESEVRDSDMEHMIMQELLGIILIETINSSEESLLAMHAKSAEDSRLRVSLRKIILEKEKAICLGVEQKEQLIQELNPWKEAMQEKEQMMDEMTVALIKTKEQLDTVNGEVNILRENANAQKLLLSGSSKEIMDSKSKLAQAFEQNRMLEVQIDVLNGNNEHMLMELNRINKERGMLLALSEEKQNALSLFTREKEEHRKHVESMHSLILGLTREIGVFQCRVAEDIEIKNSRLEDIGTQLSHLIKKSNIQRRTGLLYQQRLEKRCLDLRKAEAEVDLLGDEVDVLLSLLEKIYIALDHYSPILKHYPGIVEILKLVRRELSKESTKLHRKHLYQGASG